MAILIPGDRLRGIFHPCEYHWHMDPTGAIEEWSSEDDALDAFRTRARGGRALAYYLGRQPEEVDGYDVDGGAYMDVWVADADEEPGVPNELWQRWRLDGVGVHRENF